MDIVAHAESNVTVFAVSGPLDAIPSTFWFAPIIPLFENLDEALAAVK